MHYFQRNGARFVRGEYSRGPEISLSDMITLLKMESLQTRRQNSRLCMFYKVVNGLVALPVDTLIKADQRTRGGEHNYKPIKSNKQAYKNSFYSQTIRESNILPTEVKASQSLETFKTKLKSSD